MKNKIIITAMFFSSITYSFAQSRCEKGTWVFGINPVRYSFFNNAKSTNYSADTIANITKGTSTAISIGYNIGAGYFVKNNFFVGTGFGSYSSQSTDFPRISTDLFARYYLIKKERCFSFTRQDNTRRVAFFIQATIQGGYNKSYNENKTSYPYNSGGVAMKLKGTYYSYGGEVAVGYTYMCTRHIALELMTTYRNITLHSVNKMSPNGVYLPETKNISNNSGLNLLFGLQAYF